MKTLMKAVTGSTAYNLATPESDVDYRGIFLESPEAIIGLKNETAETLDNADDVMYGFRHFMKLLVKGNPNILELLYLPPSNYTILHPAFNKHIMVYRENFITKRMLLAYSGYVAHQLKLVEKDGRKEYSHNGMDCKAAMHVMRLILQLRDVTKKSLYVTVNGADRNWLLDIKHGKQYKDYSTFYMYTTDRLDQYNTLITNSNLPQDVDMDWVNNRMIRLFEECYYG